MALIIHAEVHAIYLSSEHMKRSHCQLFGSHILLRSSFNMSADLEMGLVPPQNTETLVFNETELNISSDSLTPSDSEPRVSTPVSREISTSNFDNNPMKVLKSTWN
jgi:hypothetical protein